jgi:hypothetical protein
MFVQELTVTVAKVLNLIELALGEIEVSGRLV